MNQLTLGLSNRLAYSAENFFPHSGVKAALESIRSGVERDGFSISFLAARPRSGKTHFSLHLFETFLREKRLPRLVEGGEFEAWIEARGGESFTADDIVIVDDAHLYFSKIKPGQSGPFVNLIETLRAARASIIFFSRDLLEKFPCDVHVKSRLNPGDGITLGDPEENELPYIVKCMGRQRGIHLTETKVDFLVRRLRRDIASIEEYFEKVSHLATVLGKSVKFPLLGDAI